MRLFLRGLLFDFEMLNGLHYRIPKWHVDMICGNCMNGRLFDGLARWKLNSLASMDIKGNEDPGCSRDSKCMNARLLVDSMWLQSTAALLAFYGISTP